MAKQLLDGFMKFFGYNKSKVAKQEDKFLYANSKYVDVKMKYINDKNVTVLPGSIIRKYPTPSFFKYCDKTLKIRQQLIDNGSIDTSGDRYVVVTEFTYSRGVIANLVYGHSMNSRTALTETKKDVKLVDEVEPAEKQKPDFDYDVELPDDFDEVMNNIRSNKKPKSLEHTYKPNFDAINDYYAKFREHQVQAIEAIGNNTIGQISIPTGTGKTFIQVYLHIKDMIEKSKNNEVGVYVIAAHRLALCSQLLDNILEQSVKCGLPFDILYIGSSRFNEDKVHHNFREYGLTKEFTEGINTTSKEEVIKAAERAKANGRHLITVTTYNSFDKLAGVESIDICTYDEAHIITQKDFTENIKKVKHLIKKEFFFTATRRIINTDFGMNDFDFFGEVLYDVSPLKMIEKGEIVPPKIHSIIVDNTNGVTPDDIADEDLSKFENKLMLIKTITSGFEEHRKYVKQFSADPDKIGAKLLVTFRGSSDMKDVHDDFEFQKWCRDNNINVMIVSSVPSIGDHWNFQKKTRGAVIDDMNTLSDKEDAILFHVDILAEGIDLPAITGVMPFRDLSKSKLLQTIGRGARLLYEDRMNLYNGKIQPGEYDKMIKPYCWVVLSNDLFTDHNQIEKALSILQAISNSYEVPFEDLSVNGDFEGKGKDDEDDNITIDKKDKSGKAEADLKHFIHDSIITQTFITKLLENDDVVNTILKELKEYVLRKSS